VLQALSGSSSGLSFPCPFHRCALLSVRWRRPVGAAELALQRTGPVAARTWRGGALAAGPTVGLSPSVQASGVLQRIVDQEAFGPGRGQQRRIGCHKQGRRHPPLVHQASHRQRAGQLHGIIGS
jgi:hypothetical protein